MLARSSRSIVYGIGRSVAEHANAFGHECFRNLPTASLALGYAVAVSSMDGMHLGTLASFAAQLLKDLCLYALVTAIVLRLAVCLVVVRPRSPFRYFAQAAGSAVSQATLGRWLARLWPFALLAAAFSAFKPTIPSHSGGFVWDEKLMEFGRLINFGYMPWQLLQPWLGHPWITRILDINYALWFIVMWMFLIGMVAFCRDETHRQRSMIAFVLIWIVAGTCLAAGFSSAGPCFYDKVVAGPNPYAELMAYLQRTHDSIGLMSVDAQAVLWNDYASGGMRFGISAMPSMHNAVAALMLLACWRLNIWLRFLLSAHALLVFLGSILLGWHYGADTYVAWGSAMTVWAAAEPLARWWTSRLQSLRFETPLPHPA